MSAPPKRLSDPPARQILPPERIDDVAEAVLALAQELWVVTDRMAIMEKVMAAHGLDLSAQIDAYEPDVEYRQKLDAMRGRLLGSVLKALKAHP